MKVYLEQNVYDAARERIRYIFTHTDHTYFSFSGGKDSTVMLHLAKDVAESLNKKFSILFIDLEAQYKHTIDHVKYMRNYMEDVTEDFYWCCLPLSLRNAVSAIQPKWTCWNESERDIWVRDMPDDCINEENCPFPFFEWDMEFEEFTPLFAKWFQEQHGGVCSAGIGIRSDESLNRFRTIVSKTKTRMNDKPYTTLVKLQSHPINVYNFYPLYDWRTEDIWHAVSMNNWPYNYIYELMYKNGVGVHQQRLCQPYGDDQRDGLDQFRVLEPETWEKVLRRVEGVNFGNIYARTSLLGNIRSEKPKHMTWQEYSVFLLESLGLYAPDLMKHYYLKIKKFLDWHGNHGGDYVDYAPKSVCGGSAWSTDEWKYSIVDEAPKKLESGKKAPSWRRVGKAIERNDFWMSRLSFGETKGDRIRLQEMRKTHGTNLIKMENTDSKPLKRVAEELELCQ